MAGHSKKSIHYGYSHYARQDVVDAYQDDRYGSPFGAYLHRLEVESYLAMFSMRGRVLDVGTGTGKLFAALAEQGRDVMGVDASPSMIAYLKERYSGTPAGGKLLVADALDLPFADASFDSVASSRVLMHLLDWRRGIRELCRVSGGEVVIDFPPVSAFTCVIPLVNVVKRAVSEGARPYRVFTLRSVRREFEKNNFEVVAAKRLFFLPVGVHRRVDNVGVTAKSEALFGRLGMTRVFGGPVLLRAQRQRPSLSKERGCRRGDSHG